MTSFSAPVDRRTPWHVCVFVQQKKIEARAADGKQRVTDAHNQAAEIWAAGSKEPPFKEKWRRFLAVDGTSRRFHAYIGRDATSPADCNWDKIPWPTYCSWMACVHQCSRESNQRWREFQATETKRFEVPCSGHLEPESSC